VYPTDRILSGGLLSPMGSGSVQSCRVELPARRWNAHGDGNVSVSKPPMKSLWVPWRGAISVLAPGSPVRLCGARLELVETDETLAA